MPKTGTPNIRFSDRRDVVISRLTSLRVVKVKKDIANQLMFDDTKPVPPVAYQLFSFFLSLLH